MGKEEQISTQSSVKNEVKLDIAISDFFKVLSKTARFRIGLKYILLAFCFLGMSWLLMGFADRIWATTIFWRSIIFFTGLLSALWAIFNVIIYSFHYTRQFSWLAKRIRKVFRAKGERLLSIIEITEEDKRGNRSFSAQIFDAAQQKMVQEINSIKIEEVFSWKKIRIPSASVCVIFLIILLAYFSHPGLTKNAFQRWSLPFASIERVTLTNILNDDAKKITILKNEFNTIRFSLSSSSQRRPNYAELIKASDSEFHLISANNGGIYEFNIPPQSKDFSVELIVGDYCKKFSVQSKSRPRLEVLSSLVKFPEYLSLKPKKFNSLNNQIEVPEHSEITLQGKANREIGKILISDVKNQFSYNKSSKEFEFNLPKLGQDKKYSLYIMDNFGFAQREPANISFKLQKDLPPSVNLAPLMDTSPVLLFETRKVSFRNEDDFGLSRVYLNCSILRGQKKIKDLEIISEKFSEIGKRNFELSFPFDPSLFKMEDGDEIVFIATAKDNFPGRELTLSKPLKLRVIGPEKHAEMIRAKVDVIISEISEIARNQEEIQFETLTAEEKVRESSEQQLDSKRTAEITDLENDQNDLANRLNITARNGSDILDEASKNPIFDSETLKDFAATLNEIKETSSGPMRESEKELNSAAASNRSQASQSMMQSAQAQQRALEALRNVLAKFSKQLDRLEARTLAQRLTKLEKTENKLSKKLVSLMPATVGRMQSQLDNQNLSSFSEMEKIQTQVSEDADEIKNEISRYHERTRKLEYGRVSQLMEEADLKQGLSTVAGRIRDNNSFKALDNLNFWESSFEKWAKLLQQESPGGDSPGGQGEGKNRTADILSLLKMRKVQSDILFKTKTLDQEGFRGNKKAWSLSLKDQQDELMIDLTDTQISVAEEVFNPLFDDAHMAMSESSDQLSKQIFDEVTQASQQESKNILSDLINLLLEGQGQGQGSKDNENLTAMELLMMQMGNEAAGQAKGNSPAPGNTGGGSSQGGSADQVTESLKGSTLAPPKNDSPSKTSSNITPSIAPEFQQLMEKYFKAIED